MPTIFALKKLIKSHVDKEQVPPVHVARLTRHVARLTRHVARSYFSSATSTATRASATSSRTGARPPQQQDRLNNEAATTTRLPQQRDRRNIKAATTRACPSHTPSPLALAHSYSRVPRINYNNKTATITQVRGQRVAHAAAT